MILTKILGAGLGVVTLAAAILYGLWQSSARKAEVLEQQAIVLESSIREQTKALEKSLEYSEILLSNINETQSNIQKVLRERDERSLEIERLKRNAKQKDLQDPFGSSSALSELLNKRLLEFTEADRNRESTRNESSSDTGENQ